jgi:hypothetical protein
MSVEDSFLVTAVILLLMLVLWALYLGLTYF